MPRLDERRVTSDHDEASNQNPGTRMMSMTRQYAAPPERDRLLGAMAAVTRAEAPRRAAVGCTDARGSRRSAPPCRSRRCGPGHDRDSVAHVTDHAQVVRDEQVRQAEGALQVVEQVEHLRLNRDIQRGHRFVADQHPGAGRDGAGDRHSLALSAGQAAGAAGHQVGGEAHRFQQVGDAIALRGRTDAVARS